MGGTVADLITVLGQSIEAFNLGDRKGWEKYQAKGEGVLTVIRDHAKKLPHHKELRGEKAHNFLEEQHQDQKDRDPLFTLRELTIHGKGIDGQMTEATIIGTAHWHDKNGDEELRFLFKAAYEDKKWAFTEVSADTIGPTR